MPRRKPSAAFLPQIAAYPSAPVLNSCHRWYSRLRSIRPDRARPRESFANGFDRPTRMLSGALLAWDRATLRPGDCTHPKLRTLGWADAALPVSGSNLSMNRTTQIAAGCGAGRKSPGRRPIRFLAPAASSCHTKSCRKTRMAFVSTSSAHRSSSSICAASKLCDCQISSWLVVCSGI